MSTPPCDRPDEAEYYAMDHDPSSSSTTTSSSWFTPTSSIGAIVSGAHDTYRTGRTRSIPYRRSQLLGLMRLVDENATELHRAMHRDLGQCRFYAEAFEFGVLKSRCRTALTNLDDWARTTRASTPWPLCLSVPIRSAIVPEPRGVVSIITPWNMPVLLSLGTLVDALASGNVCILKMSEMSAFTTRLLTSLLSSGAYVDADVVRVVNGDVEASTELLRHRVDAISYTGGTNVGRIVALAAARHLTPTLLELGGKNPCFVTRHANLRCAATRIAWGKITGNAGQMCICPDYVLVEECVKEEFLKELIGAMDEMYPVSSYADHDDDDDGRGMIEVERRARLRGDVGTMISIEHAERVVGLVDSTCEVIYGGGHHDVKNRFVSPTIVEADATSTVMGEEIFGPILAVMSVSSVDDALGFVYDRFTSRGEHPLVLYIFSHSRHERDRIMNAVPSGMCSINEVLKIGANVNVPFGGVGTSGMGASGGRHGFDFFSHRRGVLVGDNTSTSRWDPNVWVITPPFDDRKLFAFKCVAKVPLALDRLRPIIKTFVIPLALALVCSRFYPGVLMALKAMKP